MKAVIVEKWSQWGNRPLELPVIYVFSGVEVSHISPESVKKLSALPADESIAERPSRSVTLPTAFVIHPRGHRAGCLVGGGLSYSVSSPSAFIRG
jgi:hypothetical protein